MRRYRAPLFLFLSLLFLVPSVTLPAQEEESGLTGSSGRWGMYIRMRASSMKLANQGLFIAEEVQDGAPNQVVNAEWGQRIYPDLQFGFVLPNGRDQFRVRFAQFDQTLDIGQTGNFLNSWASPNAGYDEDLDGDGTVNGFECGGGNAPGSNTIPCEQDGQVDPDVLDGAEDTNFNSRRDFIRFGGSDQVLSELSTQILTVDADWARPLVDRKRYLLEGSAGLRYARTSQEMDLIYRKFGSFGAYLDSQDDSFVDPSQNVGYDADGDGNNPVIGSNSCSRDCLGDGWGDGNGVLLFDKLANVPTVDEDRITADVETNGIGLILGLRSEYVFKGRRIRESTKRDFVRTWALESSLNVGLMWGDTNYSWSETYSHERDAFPNFINWDFNGDGVFGEGPGGNDFDCNGDGLVNSLDWQVNGPCDPTGERFPSSFQLNQVSLVGMAPGIGSSVGIAGRGYPFDPYGDNVLDEGDPVGEAERNTTIVTTDQSVRDLSGEESGKLFTSLDLDLGIRWYFSRFADVSFGARASRWFDVGNVKNIRSEDSADSLADGDLTLHGFFVTLTVRPRF